MFEFAEPNFIYPDHCLLNSVPNDEFFSKQWTLRNTGQVVPTGSSYYGDEPIAGGLADADIDADLAWDITTGSDLISIGVFDTGIDSTHPDFNVPGHLLPGYDAIWNKYGVPKDSGNYGGHGTCASGIAGAVANNSVGVAGVAPACRLMAFRIFNLTGASTSVGIARAFDTARVIGIDVISNSWNGFTENSTVTDAINNAALLGRNGKGCLIFFAAGITAKALTETLTSSLLRSVTQQTYRECSDMLISMGPQATIIRIFREHRHLALMPQELRD